MLHLFNLLYEIYSIKLQIPVKYEELTGKDELSLYELFKNPAFL